MEIIRIILPLVIVGGIVTFVILRLKHKYEKGTLGKKKTKSAQHVLDSLIPFGMLFGCSIGVILSMFFRISSSSAISVGAGGGFLLGYIAYELYSKMDTEH
ncbi:hypothetical protein [Bacillus suaedae]|uniref:Group-specific protein n=1 Tax=Halalkalibacter suaedae TaxID=2822140 RepID=A0A941APP2_9BACI|nr:hypothetical protein [Bacillus suaedae]MBP3951717.1 hypothetical protein [Bacillus suaedae]